MVIAKVRGTFGRWQGTLDFDAADPTRSELDVRIDAASIDTREPKRDAHLRSADFFDAEKFPELRFVSTSIERAGDGYRVHGALTIHGVTKPVTLEAGFLGTSRDPWGNERVAFEAKTKINRKDFGLSWNQVLETGAILVGDDIDIALDVQAMKAAVSQAA
jgi:polyisoprenoid-binding protein YceI